MPNYKNGKIYKIVSPSHPEIAPYFGSTCETLSRRLSLHKADFKRGKGPTSKVLMCFQDAIILLIEEFPCESRKQLHTREGVIMLEAISRVNEKIAGRTDSEYRAIHKEETKENWRKYYEKNSDILNEKKRQHFTCECGGKYAYRHKTTHERTAKHINYNNFIRNFKNKVLNDINAVII
jgi:hypothetical protein